MENCSPSIDIFNFLQDFVFFVAGLFRLFSIIVLTTYLNVRLKDFIDLCKENLKALHQRMNLSSY